MIFIVVLSVLVLISLVGNTLVILTILINKPMHTTLNYLLVNLAVADVISALCIGIGYVMTPFIIYPEGKVGRYFCMFLIDGELAWIGAAESVFASCTLLLNATLPLFVRFVNAEDLQGDV